MTTNAHGQISITGDFSPSSVPFWTNGGDSSTNVEVGKNSSGGLTVEGGSSLDSQNAVLGRNTGGVGTATVTGAGSVWHSSQISVADSGTGILTVSAGGWLDVSGNVNFAYVGTGDASATVTGTDSRWDVGGLFDVWHDADILIEDGGLLMLQNARLAINSGSTGILTVDGAGSEVSTGGTVVVASNGTGTVTVQNGGTLTSANSVTVSENTGAIGEVNVTGTGSTWTLNNHLVLAQDGSAALNISSGALVQVTGSTRTVSSGGSGTGIITLSGGTLETGSLFANRADLNGSGVIQLGSLDGFGSLFGTSLIFSNASYAETTLTDMGDNLSVRFQPTTAFTVTGFDLLIEDGATVTTAGGAIGDLNGDTNTVTVTGGGSSWDVTGDLDVGNSGTGILNVQSGATATVSGRFAIGDSSGGNGTVTVDNATLNLDSTSFGQTSATGSMTVQNGGSVISSGNVDFNFNSGGITALTITGSGSTYVAVNEFDVWRGGTNITVADGGTLSVNKGGSAGDGEVDFGLFAGGSTLNIGGYDLGNATPAGTVVAQYIELRQSNDLLNFNQTDATTFSPDIRGGGAVEQRGSGTTTLAGDNSYIGGTTVSGGVLRIASAQGLGPGAVSVTSGGVLEFDSSAGAMSLTGNNTISGTGTVRVVGSPYSPVVEWGSGVLTMALGSGAGIDVQSGQFKAGSYANDNWSQNKADLNIGLFGFFSTSEANVYVDALTGLGLIATGYNGFGYQAMTIGVDNGSGTFSGNITDDAASGNLIKTGSGTQILTGSNTYTGTTTVENGSLIIDGSITSATTVETGGLLGGSGSIGGLVTLENGGTLAPGSSPGILTLSDGLTLQDGAILSYELGSLPDQLTITGGTLTGPSGIGGVTINVVDAGGFVPGEYILIDFTGISSTGFDASDFALGTVPAEYTYNLSVSNDKLVLTAIPEPSTLILTGLFVLAYCLFLRRRGVVTG